LNVAPALPSLSLWKDGHRVGLGEHRLWLAHRGFAHQADRIYIEFSKFVPFKGSR